MKLAVTIFLASLFVAPVALADKSYQKTGTVVEVSDKLLMLATEKEGNWEFRRDAGTRLDGSVKKGARVTVHYSVSASRVEARSDKK